MIKWIKVEDKYRSEDKRFIIDKTYNRMGGGDCWMLQDNNEENKYRGQYFRKTLKECKATAEYLESSS